MYRILIAEDDMNSRKLLWKYFEKKGYGKCDIVIDGKEALDAVMLAMDDGAYYDLMCLDIMMPKIDGIMALQLIRDLEKEREVKAAVVIMITAIGEREIINETLEEKGADAYAQKPLDLDRFTEVLERFNFVANQG